MTVVFLCGPDEIDKERRGYARAFERVAPLQFIAPGEHWREQLPKDAMLVLNPDGKAWLPRGIERVDAPTAVFHIDTYVATERRIRWSRMYDYAFVFHPGFEERFAAAGVPGARLLPHAAERDLFEQPELERRFEVGWVGRAGRSIYSERDRILAALAANFRTNDVARYYTPEEMAEVYQASKIVVNVSRDDYPRDANMRCFEAMAGGALLLTRTPTELTKLGFQEEVHFATYRGAEDVVGIAADWLRREDERSEVAARARALVLREHTYDARVATILDAIRGGTRAPARSWSPARVEALHLDYHVEYGDTAPALAAFRSLAKQSPRIAASESWRLLRLAGKRLKRRLGR
ncbi:MAG TPA: glycosyltransferase [Thermoanaerobaculia bacterium]|nr:glycosyltransferase [Thermoanaerobaculia bacterium]